MDVGIYSADVLSTRDDELDQDDRPGNSYAALEKCASHWPEKPGVKFPLASKSMTFSEWLKSSNRLANALRALGVKKGDTVALWAENRIEWTIVQTALAGLGAVLVPVNTHFRDEDLKYVLNHARAKVILLSRNFRSGDYLNIVNKQRNELPFLQEVICFDATDEPGIHSFEAILEKASDQFQPTPIDPREMGSVQYTSGTTGQPKGAALSFKGMMDNALESATRLQITQDDRWTSIIPLFHCAGCIMNLMGCLSKGATYVGVPAFDPVHMFQIIEKEACTLLTGVPTSYLSMLQHPDRQQYDLSSLRAGTCGGSDCDPVVLSQCAAEFPIKGLVQVYGQTEASTLIALDFPDSALRWETSGLPLPGMEVRITHPESREVLAPTQIGQIEVRGSMVMLGYLNQPDATQATIDPQGWMQTGDLGYLRPDGRVVIAGGRLRDMIIRGGENIYPVEIENILRDHPLVSEVSVFGMSDTYYGEVVCAAVSVKAPVTPADMKKHLEGKIAGFKHPVKYFLVTEWPMTSSGKIKKRDLKQAAVSNALVEIA